MNETQILLGVVLVLLFVLQRQRFIARCMNQRVAGLEAAINKLHASNITAIEIADQIIEKMFEQMHVPNSKSPDRVIRRIFSGDKRELHRQSTDFLDALESRLRNVWYRKSLLAQAVHRACKQKNGY